MDKVRLVKSAESVDPDRDTPAMRLFSLLEVIAAKDRLCTLQGLVEETGWPKPTLHRMLQQLDAAGLLEREGNGRFFKGRGRLRGLAQTLLFKNTLQGAPHPGLRHPPQTNGESCDLRAPVGPDVGS